MTTEDEPCAPRTVIVTKWVSRGVGKSGGGAPPTAGRPPARPPRRGGRRVGSLAAGDSVSPEAQLGGECLGGAVCAAGVANRGTRPGRAPAEGDPSVLGGVAGGAGGGDFLRRPGGRGSRSGRFSGVAGVPCRFLLINARYAGCFRGSEPRVRGACSRLPGLRPRRSVSQPCPPAPPHGLRECTGPDAAAFPAGEDLGEGVRVCW